MDDIPGFVWVIVGGFVTLVSLFLGFIRPVTYNSFFKLMFVVGVGMLVYGYIFKMRLGRKSKEDVLEERRQQLMKERGDYEADIDIDDYRNNPALRQAAMKNGYPSSQPNQNFYQAERRFQQNIQQKNNQNPVDRERPQYQAQQPQQNQFSNANQFARPNPQIQSQKTFSQGFCPSCGTPLLKEHKFCPICGARV